jgi:hypothetical protein
MKGEEVERRIYKEMYTGNGMKRKKIEYQTDNER